MARRVTTAEAAEGLRVAGFSCSRDAAAPKKITNGCGKEQREVTGPTLEVQESHQPTVSTFQLQVKKHGNRMAPVFPAWALGPPVGLLLWLGNKTLPVNVFAGQPNTNWVLVSLCSLSNQQSHSKKGKKSEKNPAWSS